MGRNSSDTGGGDQEGPTKLVYEPYNRFLPANADYSVGCLGRVCRDLQEIAGRTAETAHSIARSNLALRVSVGVLVGLILGGLVVTVLALEGTVEPLRFADRLRRHGSRSPETI